MLSDFVGRSDGISCEETASSGYGSFSAGFISLPEVNVSQVWFLLYLDLFVGYMRLKLTSGLHVNW
jgi:hypothetical protein